MYVGVSPLSFVFIFEATTVISVYLLILIIASDFPSVGITCSLDYLLSFRSYYLKLQLSLQCTPFFRNSSAFSRQPLPIACLHLVKSFQLSCHQSILACLWLAKYLPKIRQLSICLVHGSLLIPIASFSSATVLLL